MEIFKLSPNPIWIFPHSEAFIQGEGRELTAEGDFDAAVESFKNEYSTKKLDWDNRELKSMCFEYDIDSAMLGELTGNIKCFVRIKTRGNFGLGGDYALYTFEILNFNGYIEKVDPDREILRHSINNLKEI